jgi:hypothetical protein
LQRHRRAVSFQEGLLASDAEILADAAVTAEEEEMMTTKPGAENDPSVGNKDGLATMVTMIADSGGNRTV